jgi:CO/xanthine dehydrogenase Mo-binding subunit
MVRHGATDMGQGANLMVAEVAGRVFGVPARYIKVHAGDTRDDPPGGMTTASRATFLSGNAVLKASQKLRALIWTTISSEFCIPEDEVMVRDGLFVHTLTGKPLISLKDLADGEQEYSVNFMYEAPETQPPPSHSESYPDKLPAAPMHIAYDFGVQAALVAANPDTGEVRVLKLVAAHDVGATLLHRNVIGQIEGAAIQGTGYALSEEFIVKDGIPQTTRLKDLGLLRYKDIPPIIPIIVEDYHPKGPFGAKGMGELAISPTAPAIANAIHDALGVWINSLPMTKGKILSALGKKIDQEVR